MPGKKNRKTQGQSQPENAPGQESGRPPGQRPNPAARRDAQRQARVEASRKQRRRIRQLVVLGVLAVAAAIAIPVTLNALKTEPGILTPDEGRDHLAQGVAHTKPYATDPPTSGPHWQSFAPVGKAITTDEPNEENLHRLEHGYVVVNHNCDVTQCADVYNALEKIWRSYGSKDKLVLNYRPRTQARIALTAWRRLDTMDAVDEKRIKRFIDAYLDKGPEKAP